MHNAISHHLLTDAQLDAKQRAPSQAKHPLQPLRAPHPSPCSQAPLLRWAMAGSPRLCARRLAARSWQPLP